MSILRTFFIAAVFVFGAVMSNADDLPVVKVAVVIESKTVKGLRVNIPEAEREAALEIVRKIGESANLSFVRWLPDQSKAKAEARLKVTLFDRKPHPNLPSDHYLRYEAELLAPEAKIKTPVLDYAKGTRVFETYQKRKKLGSRKDIAEELGDIVVAQLALRRPHFLSVFLYKVPLSRTKPTLADDGMIVVQVPWGEIGATPESILWIDISAKPPKHRRSEPGQILVWKLFPCANCESPSARGLLKEFNCHGIGNVPPDPWKGDVAKNARAGLTSHVVYMKEYLPRDGAAPPDEYKTPKGR